jgi:hypothetical protein
MSKCGIQVDWFSLAPPAGRVLLLRGELAISGCWVGSMFVQPAVTSQSIGVIGEVVLAVRATGRAGRVGPPGRGRDIMVKTEAVSPSSRC